MKNKLTTESQNLADDEMTKHGLISLALGVVVALLGCSLFAEPSAIRYMAFLAWCGALMLILRGWVSCSVGRETSRWSFQRVINKLAGK